MAVTHSHSPSMPAAIELEAVERELAELEQRERQAREHLSRISLQTAQQLQVTQGGTASEANADRPLAELLQEASALDIGVKYLDALEELQQSVAGLRDGLISIQGLLKQDNWHDYLRAVLQDPLQQYRQVQASSNAFMEVPTMGLPDRLVKQGSRALSKGKEAQDAVLEGLNKCLKVLLRQTAWPPPLASDPDFKPPAPKRARSTSNGALLASDHAADTSLQEEEDSAAAELRLGAAQQWNGFDAAGPVVLTGLQQCVQALMVCQQGVVESTSFPVDQLPMLEVIQTITEPLLAKLRFHFASGRPTDRIDQPDWLFETAARATKEHYEAFKMLQPAVEAAGQGLGQTFYLPWEFAHAMRAAVQTVLREHVLPRLAQQGTQDLWTLFADAAVRFEKSMSLLRGVYIDDSQMEHDGPFAWGRGSCLELVCSRDSWRDAWLSAEAQDGEEQLVDIMDRINAWDPAPSVSDPLTGKDKVAWQEEFWPTTAAEYMLHLLWTLCKRALWVYDPDLRQSYTTAVLKALLKAFRAKLGRLAKMAEDLHNLASPDWIPKIACYANTCHYLEYHLRQSHLPVLLLYDPSSSSSHASSPQQGPGRPHPSGLDTPAPSVSLTPHQTPPNSRLWTPQSSVFTSPADSLAELPASHARTDINSAHAQLSAFDSEASAYGSFWKKWSLKLARAIAHQFHLDSRSYKYRSHLVEFSNTSYGGEDGGEVISPQLRSALIALNETLRLLSSQLDAVVFRETWKAIAVAINRELYNEVATEAKFSLQGGRQLAFDAHTLFTVFQPYTFKPAAHFKELRDACVLLALEPDSLQNYITLLQNTPANPAKQKLKEIGVLRLSPDQALSILEQRI